MIRGYFTRGAIRRPFVSTVLQFPTFNDLLYAVEFLVDTGADRTLLSPVDAATIGIDIPALPLASPSRGVGDRPVPTRTIEAVLTLQYFSSAFTLHIPETPNPIPSLLGRDILSHFALFMEERTSRVLLLEPQEADALPL